MANTILQKLHPSPIASKIRTIALAIMLGLGAALTVGSNAQAAQEVNMLATALGVAQAKSPSDLNDLEIAHVAYTADLIDIRYAV